MTGSNDSNARSNWGGVRFTREVVLAALPHLEALYQEIYEKTGISIAPDSLLPLLGLRAMSRDEFEGVLTRAMQLVRSELEGTDDTSLLGSFTVTSTEDLASLIRSLTGEAYPFGPGVSLQDTLRLMGLQFSPWSGDHESRLKDMSMSQQPPVTSHTGGEKAGQVAQQDFWGPTIIRKGGLEVLMINDEAAYCRPADSYFPWQRMEME